MSAAATVERPAERYVPPPAYHPRWDPDFADVVIGHLMRHMGEWCRLSEVFAVNIPSHERCCVIRDAVKNAQRLGFCIEGDRGRGYRMQPQFQGHHYVHLAKALAWPPETEPVGHTAQMPGQLPLLEQEE